MNARPFGHPEPREPARLRLSFPLQGPAYRFVLLLPALDVAGNTLFTREERDDLRTLFAQDFGGHTCDENVVQPLLAGGSISDAGEHVVNRHTRFEVLAKQTNEAVQYFEGLATKLAEHSRRVITTRLPGYRGESQIFVEMSPVAILNTWLAFEEPLTSGA